MLVSAGSPFIVPPLASSPRPASAEASRASAETPEAEPLSDEQLALQKLQAATNAQNKSDLPFGQSLSEEEKRVVDDLKQTDEKVRAHEQSHKAAAGGFAGAIQLETVTGPDGQEYAVGGEVPIDVSPVSNNPQATIQKMDIVIRAALAPSDPSSQDFAVARAAQQARAQAQKEVREQREAEQAAAQDGNENGLLDANVFAPNETSSERQGQLLALLESLNNVQAQDEERRGRFLDITN